MADSELDLFNVCVKIYEANDLPHPDMSTLVGIQVGRNKKYSHVVYKSSNPYFNEYFVFDIISEFSALMNTVITISLYEGRKKLRGKRLVGSLSLDVATVWAQLNHVLKKWLTLLLPSDPAAQAKGFIKCEINIDAGETYKQIPQIMPMEVPKILGGLRARYMIQVYKCIGLDIDGTHKENTQVHVSATYAGQTGTTTKRRYGGILEWNEVISFIELFPPLYQRITIGVYVGKFLLVERHFYLTDFGIISIEGHLPTYGPTYIHMYTDNVKYQCSVLLAIDCEVVTTLRFMEKLHGVTHRTIQPLIQAQYGMTDSFFCCGVLFDALLTDKRFADNNITFSVSFGGVGRRPCEENFERTASHSIKAVLGEGQFSYLPLNEKKPCVAFRSEWPDTRHRLSNSNMICKLAQDLRERVDYAHDLIARGIVAEAKGILKSSLQTFKSKCLDMPSSFTKGITPFDFERTKFLTQQLEEISSSNVTVDDIAQLLEWSNSYLAILDIIYKNVQDSLPNLVMTLNIDQTVIGHYTIHPRQIIYSKHDNKKGADCGKINSIILKSHDDSDVGRIDVWLWLGFYTQVSYCLGLLPPGHQDLTKIVSLPPIITYLTKQKYSVVCHIFGGHILGGMGNEGLCDSKVSVMISNQVRETKVVKRSLVPLWKETLVFQDLRFYPLPSYIQDNPPLLTVKLLDSNPWPKPARLIGSALVKPNVRLQPITQIADYNLQWISLGLNSQVLAAFDLIQITDIHGQVERKLTNIMPTFIDPPFSTYRVEVVFWGIRPFDVRGVISINKPQLKIQCSSTELQSDAIAMPHIFPNFQHDLHVTEVEIPEIKLYSPPFVLRVVSSTGYTGCNVVRNINQYICELPTKKQRNSFLTNRKSVFDRAANRHSSFNVSMPDLIPLMEVDPKRRKSITLGSHRGINRIKAYFCICTNCICRCMKSAVNRLPYTESDDIDDVDEDEKDWWYKYYSGYLKVYQNDLETEFGDFSDVLKTYDIEQNMAGRSVKVAKVKIMICMYKWPTRTQLVTPEGEDPEMGVLKHSVISDQVKLLVRVYCVRAHNLHPCDSNGKSDPYIEIATQTSRISDATNYIPKELNPVFGKCIEVSVTFPIDTQLVVRVMDWDLVSVHDLIGETVIDIENRLYSKHRATCGLTHEYFKTGYNSWRDIEPPTKILERLCNTYNLPLPQYFERSVVVACKEFIIRNKTKDKQETQERLALSVLHHWKDLQVVGQSLVPEHVETRSLYNKERPGLIQGTLEMWVDLFDLSLGPIPPAIDIRARPLQDFELRVIIWNTTHVPLVDNAYIVGKKHTDIFVKGWLGDAKAAQSTDVHYTSINGEGSFNWRFIFPMLYNRPENKMVIYKKGKFEIGKAEFRFPPELTLQVWDSDRVTADDFIGYLTLDLSQMLVGSKSARWFNMRVRRRTPRTVNLFKVRRLRGWWPFMPAKNSGMNKAGFVEAEFHLLTGEQALAAPAGLGRSPPAELPPPIRPEFRIRFWLAPFRVLTHIICVNKGAFLVCLCTCSVVLFFMVGIYSVPMFIVKRVLGA